MDTTAALARRTVYTAPTWVVSRWLDALGYAPEVFADLNRRPVRELLVETLSKHHTGPGVETDADDDDRAVQPHAGP